MENAENGKEPYFSNANHTLVSLPVPLALPSLSFANALHFLDILMLE